MTDLYSEWRDFYAKRVSSWMSLEELRAECGMLLTEYRPIPEALLVHAMHALEEHEQRDKALLQQALRALKDIQNLSSIDSATTPNPFTLIALLAEIHYIAATTLAKENSND